MADDLIMKSIENKTYTIDTAKLTTADLLNAAIAQSPFNAHGQAMGFDFALNRARGRVADVLEKLKLGEPIQLEDADYQTAVDAVRLVRWNRQHKVYDEFSKQFGL